MKVSITFLYDIENKNMNKSDKDCYSAGGSVDKLLYTTQLVLSNMYDVEDIKKVKLQRFMLSTHEFPKIPEFSIEREEEE